MAISPLTLKILGCISVSSIALLSSYFVSDDFSNARLTKYDHGLLSQINNFSTTKPAVGNGEENGNNEDSGSNINMTIFASFNEQTPTIKFTFNISWNDEKTTVEDMKAWECIIEWKIRDVKNKSIKKDVLETLKKPFGINYSSSTDFNKEQKTAVSKFIRSCANFGERWVTLDENKKLTRTIQLDTKLINKTELQLTNFKNFF